MRIKVKEKKRSKWMTWLGVLGDWQEMGGLGIRRLGKQLICFAAVPFFSLSHSLLSPFLSTFQVYFGLETFARLS
jgi:hypothetical protein